MLSKLIGLLCELGKLTIIATKFGHELEGKSMCHAMLHHGLYSTIASMAKFLVPCEDECSLIAIRHRGVRSATMRGIVGRLGSVHLMREGEGVANTKVGTKEPMLVRGGENETPIA